MHQGDDQTPGRKALGLPSLGRLANRLKIMKSRSQASGGGQAVGTNVEPAETEAEPAKLSSDAIVDRHPEDAYEKVTSHKTEKITTPKGVAWRKGDDTRNSLLPTREFLARRFARRLGVRSPDVDLDTYENGRPCSLSYHIPGKAYEYNQWVPFQKYGAPITRTEDYEIFKKIAENIQFTHDNPEDIHTYRVLKGEDENSYSVTFQDNKWHLKPDHDDQERCTLSGKALPHDMKKIVDEKVHFLEKTKKINFAEYGREIAFHRFLGITDVDGNNIQISDLNDESIPTLYTIDHERSFQERIQYSSYPKEIEKAVKENPEPFKQTVEKIKKITDVDIDAELSAVGPNHVSSRRIGQFRTFLENHRNGIEYYAQLQAKSMEFELPLPQKALAHKNSKGSVRSTFLREGEEVPSELPLRPEKSSRITRAFHTIHDPRRALKPIGTVDRDETRGDGGVPRVVRRRMSSDTRHHLTATQRGDGRPRLGDRS